MVDASFTIGEGTAPIQAPMGAVTFVPSDPSAVDEAEYEICQRRGHQECGVSMSIGWETWQRCRWCNTEYRFGEPRLIERD